MIDDDVLAYLDSLVVIEPSHQPYNVRGARALAEAFPGLPQVACFDTSFHRTMPEVAQTYALPKDVRDAGVRHWGYHGISYDYISRQIPKFAPGARRADRRASRRRRQHVRHAGWPQRRDHDGLRRRVRPADGDALRRRVRPTRCSTCCAGRCSTTRRWKRCCTSAPACSGSPAISERHAGAPGQHRPAGRRSGRVFRLRHDEIRRRLCGRAWRAGRLRVHRRHRRALRPGARGAVRQVGLARVKLDAQANAANGPRISTPDSRVSVG